MLALSLPSLTLQPSSPVLLLLLLLMLLLTLPAALIPYTMRQAYNREAEPRTHCCVGALSLSIRMTPRLCGQPRMNADKYGEERQLTDYCNCTYARFDDDAHDCTRERTLRVAWGG